jgi:hypothetical protein
MLLVVVVDLAATSTHYPLSAMTIEGTKIKITCRVQDEIRSFGCAMRQLPPDSRMLSR